MGKVFGTCGHQIFWKGEQGFGNPVTIWEVDREGEKVHAHHIVCDSCFPTYSKHAIKSKENK